MSIELFHQCGHNPNWNITSFSKHGCGDGLILSPVHLDRGRIEKLPEKLRAASLFDPQFYLPSSQKRKLSTYEFFPEVITQGFTTIDFMQVAKKSALDCVAFQHEMGFRGIVIPTRYIDQMRTDFIEQQEAYAVLPFLEAIEGLNVEQPVYLTLALTGAMITDKGYRTQLLNWATSHPRIDGLYLVPCIERSGKQVDDAEALADLLFLVAEMEAIGLKVVVGYLNTEALLLTLVDGVGVTMGSFENTRLFSVDKFMQNEEERRGPKARIYLPRLLSWIQFSQAKDISEHSPKLWREIYTATTEADAALAQVKDPSFNQPPLYYHHFRCMTQQIQELSDLSGDDRFSRLDQMISLAIQLHQKICESNISLDKHSRGDYLPAWQAAIRRYWNSC